jgi:tetratricopeptide (TPR) repeat protein
VSNTPEADLAALLLSLYDADALRHRLWSHPTLLQLLPTLDSSQRAASLAHAVVVGAQQRGILHDLYAAIREDRPLRAAEIDEHGRRLGLVVAAAAVVAPRPRPERRAIGLLRVDANHGVTAWLAAADRIVASRSGVEGLPAGFPLVFELPDAAPVGAVVEGSGADCVVLKLAAPLHDRAALAIAGRCVGRASGACYGYARPDVEWLTPADGVLLLPRGESPGTLAAYSEILATYFEQERSSLTGAPVVVDGAVVGMVCGMFEHPDAPGHALSSLLKICASDQVLRVLGRGPDVAEIAGIDTTIAPAIDPRDHHVVLACAVPDLAWTHRLQERLWIHGFHSVVRELGPRRHPGGPDPHLGNSHAAIVVLSRHLVGSPASAELAERLVARCREDPEFRLVAVRVDDTPLPYTLEERPCIDFRGLRWPMGPRWNELVHTLVWQGCPDPSSPKGALEQVEVGATDTMTADLWGAAQAGPSEIMRVWSAWRVAGAIPLAPALQASEYLIAQSCWGLALEVLATCAGRECLRAEQMRALALDRMGRHEASLQILERLHRESALDAESTGLLAGRYKRTWESTGQPIWLDKALDLYSAAYERSHDTYVGINLAALALYSGQPERSAAVAHTIIRTICEQPERTLDHWQLATLAEAHHLIGDMTAARRWYLAAVKLVPNFHSDIATMRRQARRNARCFEQPESILDDILVVPRVVAFAGFPPHRVPQVREAIRDHLRELNAGYGFCSLARGSDILFAEEMVARHGQLAVHLPFPRDEFEATSVGPRWRARFFDLLEDPRVRVEVLQTSRPPPRRLATAYEDCMNAILLRARRHAEFLGDSAVLLTVWNGRPGDGPGGTAEAVRYWQQQGLPAQQIEL